MLVGHDIVETHQLSMMLSAGHPANSDPISSRVQGATSNERRCIDAADMCKGESQRIAPQPRVKSSPSSVQFMLHDEMLDFDCDGDWELPALPHEVDGLYVAQEDAIIRKSIRASAEWYEKWAKASAIETHMQEMRQEQLQLKHMVQLHKFLGHTSGLADVGLCNKLDGERCKSPGSCETTMSETSTVSVRSAIAHSKRARGNKHEDRSTKSKSDRTSSRHLNSVHSAEVERVQTKEKRQSKPFKRKSKASKIREDVQAG